MYHEARGEGTEGMMAVTEVVMNRVEHKAYPDDICSVIQQPSREPSKPRSCAFSWSCDGKTDLPVKPATVPHRQVKRYKDAKKWREAKRLARLSVMGIYGFAIVGKPATIYVRCDRRHKVKWDWKKLKFVGKIGSHCFYSEK